MQMMEVVIVCGWIEILIGLRARNVVILNQYYYDNPWISVLW